MIAGTWPWKREGGSVGIFLIPELSWDGVRWNLLFSAGNTSEMLMCTHTSCTLSQRPLGLALSEPFALLALDELQEEWE